ncbi:hypothetical protein GA0070216_1449 [Micromonospora matsumotoense]|uniref:Uncharacterized protein n=1 Tax=Micromonospora matsumotoense TaxID=121616 RepID=A0A1C5AXW4_9ACTN|nr:hypothetical protein [Micromonospora matsumotoense]SCF50013.1 hypothetical protein GA0070216_1449 [Micromonospora matsumotoense]
MREHPCQLHQPGHHTDACLTGPCGFCGTDLRTTASGECRSCLRIVCETCDAEKGPICAPCAEPGTRTSGPGPASTPPPDGYELHRLCVFVLRLSCGHLVTYFTNGWYPVVVSCCDRLGGTTLRGIYVPYSSHVDYVDVLSERYEHRPTGSPREPAEVRGRWPRTDNPYRSPYPGSGSSTGRYPASAGAAWSLDGSTAPAESS